MRARGFCIRDLFSDALRGIKTEEEVSDYIEGTVKHQSNAVLDLLKPSLVTEAQLETIKGLISISDMDEARLSKAKMHFGIVDLVELSEGQANEFIAILNKGAGK